MLVKRHWEARTCSTLESEAFRLFYVKTNERRGGFVENIRMENVKNVLLDGKEVR